MFKYSLKSIIKRNRVISILYILALVLATTLSTLTINISKQINEGFYMADNKYDVIVGSAGSDTQLVMSSLFFSDNPVGTINYEKLLAIKEKYNTEKVIGMAVSDNYKGARVIGVDVEFLDDYKIKEGEKYKNIYEVVVGSTVAQRYNLKIGDSMVTTHGLAGVGHNHEATPYKLVGILEKTNSAYDNVIFSNIESVWAIHGHEHNEEEHVEEGNVVAEHSEEEHAEEYIQSEHDTTEHKITAILIRSGSMQTVGQLIQEYHKDSTQAVSPTKVMRKLLTNIDLSKQITWVLTGIIVILSVLIITMLSLMLLNNLKEEVAVLRFISLSELKIKQFVAYQIQILFSIAILITLLCTKICLVLTGNIASKYGLVFNTSKMYVEESVFLGFIIIIGLLITTVFNKRLFDKEILN